MAEPGGGWPEGFADKADRAIEKIEKDVGTLQGLSGGLWDESGRLERCQEITMYEKIGWAIRMQQDQRPQEAEKFGDLGFHVGSWWINTAAAVRDGIIAYISMSITVTPGPVRYAHAFVMTGDHEGPGSTDNTIKLVLNNHADSLAFMGNLSEHKAIRILRDHNLNSPRAPKAGVRYDGLYRMTHWSTKLVELDAEKDQWNYLITLERCAGQEALSVALSHPNEEEMKDWEKYLEEKDAKVKDMKEVDVKSKGVFIQWLPSEEEKATPDMASLQYKVRPAYEELIMPPYSNYGV